MFVNGVMQDRRYSEKNVKQEFAIGAANRLPR